MRIERLSVRNFRGIKTLEWSLKGQPICCLIGAGDSAKTTVLDAAEAALSPRWITFNEADFHEVDTSQEILIEVTIGELSNTLLADGRFGLYIRGLAEDGSINDEPEDSDQPVLTVRLSVDATMEPVWSLVCDRYPVPRILSNRDRAMFCLVRLAGDEARHLTWAQGSVLSKITGANDETAQLLAQAYRTARTSANLKSVAELSTAAGAAEKAARKLGAYVSSEYGPDLELGRGGFNAGSIALHDGLVPLRLAGLGTRRLATLAVQRSAISEGAIVLVDELEQGLEPHRVMGAMAQLRKWQAEAEKDNLPRGQILMTTHSDVVIGELPPPALFVMHRKDQSLSGIKQACAGGDLSRIMKHAPRALFARRILVCEGATELGLMLGLRETYAGRHDNVPIEQLGGAIINGQGAAAPPLAAALAWLGYQVALFRDSDRPLDKKWAGYLSKYQVPVLEYMNAMNTEQAVFLSAPDASVEDLLTVVMEGISEATLLDHLRGAFPGTPVEEDFSQWGPPLNAVAHRLALANLAIKMKWFKSEERGRAIAPAVLNIIQENAASALAQCLLNIEQWFYVDA
ncbi:ATP-dependent nuclease [Pseudomonas kurunegalensis]|uniref:ATP-dependent nuclease n=1 Tax=Pseudomonas kurunegalensis TaxID=485880 RepID=UPI0023641CC1|nr:AAA family ATPase [Pseudomonas kurunegalensis]MDD2133460.1 ATP-binding protein [Pseudomonas kurunegalensis]